MAKIVRGHRMLAYHKEMKMLSVAVRISPRDNQRKCPAAKLWRHRRKKAWRHAGAQISKRGRYWPDVYVLEFMAANINRRLT